jgi:16S rRNA G966 N2-methylase RsmD
LIEKNIRQCSLTERATIIRCDIGKGLRCLESCHLTFDLVFMDPPYGKGLVSAAMRHLHADVNLSSDAVIVAEHEPGAQPEPPPARWRLTDHRRYGQTCLSFYRTANG